MAMRRQGMASIPDAKEMKRTAEQRQGTDKQTTATAKQGRAKRSIGKAANSAAREKRSAAKQWRSWAQTGAAPQRRCSELHSNEHKKTERKKQPMKTIKVKCTFTEPILGTWPSNPKIAEDFIASKAPDASTMEEEIAALGVEEVTSKAMTVFPRQDGKPVIYDYQIKGFFKDSCGVLSRIGGRGSGATESSKLKAYKKIIDGLIFPAPRCIPIDINGNIATCQRPLRAQTMQGERVSLANSEEIPAGSSITFEIKLLDPSLESVVLEWLDYGALRGLGQWRNSGKGRFSYEILEG